jgi:outer membrane protein assembly factor BamB
VVRLFLIAVLATLFSSVAWGQQPTRKPEPYVAPVLPAEAAWATTLAAPPTAGGALDDVQVYVPLQDISTIVEGENVTVPGTASIAALDRATGTVRWYNPLESKWPPVVGGGTLYVATSGELHALNALTGLRQWNVPLPAELRAPMLLRGNLLVALTVPDVLIAIRTDTHEIVWRRPLGESGGVLMDADQQSIYVTTERGRVMRINIADGLIKWDRPLADASLSAPAVHKDRLFVGSSTNAMWALDTGNGKDKWHWPAGKFFGGDIVGAAADGDTVFVASRDNMIRGLDRGNGNQLWKRALGTLPLAPPRVFFGTVVVTGLAPTLTTINGKTWKNAAGALVNGGVLVSTWAAPADAELQGPPLIDEYLKPFQVAIVVIMRDGRITGLRPTGMMFAEPAIAAPTVLPGRPLPRERLPGEPEPVAGPAPTVPR